MRDIPDELMLTWESQVKQFPFLAPPGVDHLAVLSPVKPDSSLKPISEVDPKKVAIHCYTYRDDAGLLIGILYYYAKNLPFEKKGNFNVFVHPDHRRNRVATTLLTRALEDQTIDFEQQRYSITGRKFITQFRGEMRSPNA